MAHLKEHWLPYLLGLIILWVFFTKLVSNKKNEIKVPLSPSEKEVFRVPNINDLTNSEFDNLIRYGKVLIDSTSKYFGPRGTVAAITNGLNCQNCHRESGTKLFTNNFFSVASSYPKFRERSGRFESVEWRINECMQRSLNGEPIDSLSKEMRAMVAYIKWVGKDIKKNGVVEGTETKEIDFLDRAANPAQGAIIYNSKCRSCHGGNGEGIISWDSTGYTYPPLWGPNSYAVSAGMYRITRLASFIKHNMPQGATYDNPQLTNEEAWDLAAYINSQFHPNKKFQFDWPLLSSKPIDYPFGPYTDSFTEKQHKYGPFGPIKKAKELAKKSGRLNE